MKPKNINYNTEVFLREKDVKIIKSKLKENITKTAIAKQFGVSITTISGIASGKIWKNI